MTVQQWERVAEYLGTREMTADTMAEIIEMQILLHDLGGTRRADGQWQRRYERKNIEIPVEFAGQIVTALRKVKNPQGRQSHSFRKKRHYNFIIEKAKEHKLALIAGGMKRGEAHKAAVEWAQHPQRIGDRVLSDETIGAAINRAKV